MHPAQKKSILSLLKATELLVSSTKDLLILDDYDFNLPVFPGTGPVAAAARAPSPLDDLSRDMEEAEKEAEAERMAMMSQEAEIQTSWEEQRKIFDEEVNPDGYV